jgi:transposase
MISSHSSETKSQNSNRVNPESFFFAHPGNWEQKAFHYYNEAQKLDAENRDLKSQLAKIQDQLANAAEKIKNLLKMLFGSKSERDPKPKDESQDPKPKPSRTRKGNHGGGRRELPDNLPRTKVECLIDRKKLAAEGIEIIRSLGWLDKESLECEPMKLWVHVQSLERLEVIMPNGDIRIITATRPDELIPRSQASNSVLASVCFYKFAFGLPLFRIAQMLQQYELAVTRATLARWIIILDQRLRPVLAILEQRLLRSGYIGIDETDLQVLREPGRKAQAKSYMWVRITQRECENIVLFHYSPHRTGEVARQLLEGFSGFVQADGYSGYEAATNELGLTRLGCAMHARRKFVEANVASPSGVDTLCAYAVNQFKKLYKIEADTKSLDPTARYQARNQEALPLWANLLKWCQENLPLTRPKSKLASAMTYFINQYEFLIGYLQNGRLRIDNGSTERIIRPFAIGRKSWLFADTVAGAEANATFYSIITTIRLNQLPLFSTLKAAFDCLSVGDSSEVYEKIANIITGKPPPRIIHQ